MTHHGFDDRIVEYEKIHQITQESFDELLRAINPQAHEAILCGMDGYGGVCSHLLGKNLNLYILDESEVQLNRGKERIHELPGDHFVLGDMRSTAFADNTFDAVVIKMGVHEVPQKDQLAIFKEVFRILKPSGRFITWELALTNENQKLFQDFIREKDRLAGFDALVKNRYFPRKEEMISYYAQAGFQNIEECFEFTYRPSTWGRREELVSRDRIQLGSVDQESEKQLKVLGEERAKELAEFVRKVFPEALKDKMGYSDEGQDISFAIRKAILRGQKPVA